MNYPQRKDYHGIRAHIHWIEDLLKYRRESNTRIARLEGGIQWNE